MAGSLIENTGGEEGRIVTRTELGTVEIVEVVSESKEETDSVNGI
jgi:hypothetical protein